MSWRWSASAEFLNFRAVEVGHCRVQERRWFLRGRKPRQQRFLASLERVHLHLQLRERESGLDRLNDLLNVALDPLQLAFRTAQTCPLLHAKPVHLLRELAAELLEEFMAHQLVLKRAQHPLLDFGSRDRQLIRARVTVAGTEAPEQLARIDDEAGAALAALREPREQVLRSPELVEAPAFLRRLPLALNARVSRVYRLPSFIVDDPQL